MSSRRPQTASRPPDFLSASLMRISSEIVELDRWLADRGVRWPDNLFAGVSVTVRANLNRVERLLQTRARVKWVSNEPARDELRLGSYLSGLDWIVIGGESGPGAKTFSMGWARKAIEECGRADVPLFVKQLGATPYEPEPPLSLKLRDAKGADWNEWGDYLRVRQMPMELAWQREKVL